MKNSFFAVLTILLSVTAVYGAGLAGTCGDLGQPACTLDGLGPVVQKGLQFILLISGLVIILAVVKTGISFAQADDKATALKEAKERLKRVVIGLILITIAASITGYLALLQLGGVGGNVLDIVSKFFGVKASAFLPVTHAYAQEAGKLPNPIPGATNLYDFLALLLKLFIRWFVFPVLIFSWVFTGFKYVSAQGNPEKLTEAHKYLWYTLIGTVIIMLAEGFATAISGTISQFFS